MKPHRSRRRRPTESEAGTAQPIPHPTEPTRAGASPWRRHGHPEDEATGNAAEIAALRDAIAEHEQAYRRKIRRLALLLMLKRGPDAYDLACIRFTRAWHARTDEPGAEVFWWDIAEAVRSLEAIVERRC